MGATMEGPFADRRNLLKGRKLNIWVSEFFVPDAYAVLHVNGETARQDCRTRREERVAEKVVKCCS